jgi:uncharacterized DUF497 family protein
MRFTSNPKKAASNIVDHEGVTFEEASELFTGDAPLLTRPDNRHYEPRFQTIGPSTRRLLMVVWTEPAEEEIHFISARKATPAERRFYRKYAR